MRNLICLSCLACLLAAPAHADVAVGDKPTLKFNDFLTHKSVDLADLHGKIVVVDFWATWCKPCMAEADHLVAVNSQYAGKGFQFLGVSLDQVPSTLKTVMAEKKFTWPVSFEGQAWNGSIPKAWGVTSIPQTFIIGPDGDVLWRGSPAQIDQPLADAFRDHPPQLVDPRILQQAAAILDEVEKDLAGDQPARAVKRLASFPEAAKLDTETDKRFTDVSAKLQDYGNSELAAVDPLIQSQQYTAAVEKLRDLSAAFIGTPVAASAKSRLTSLGSDPKVQQVVAEQKAEQEASDALAVANKLKADKKDELAYPRFKAIVKEYPKTSAAPEAAAAVKAYEADTAFITRFNNKANTGRAESMLSMAGNYQSAGNLELAKKKYQEVIDQFPNTDWAATARKAIADMGN